jgi:predicted nucleic acid-binding protein
VTLVLFPDTTALINFATIERMDLLEKIAAERAWCGSVSDECSAWAREPDLSSIRRAWDIFGEPLRPDTPVEHLTTRTYYERLRVPGEPRTKNLGEAETLAIIECRSLPAILCTDDHAVHDLVAGTGAGYPKVIGTWDLLRIGYKRDFATADELWQYSRILHQKQRHTPPTGPFDRGKFNSWLNG